MYLVDDGTAQAGGLGVMKNGVEIFGRYSPCGFGSKCKTQAGCPSAAKRCQVDVNAPSNIVDAVDAEFHTVDVCGGHPAPNGGYHIHTFHSGNRTICGDDQYLPHDTPGQHSELLGWMYDGFGIYGSNSQGGIFPSVLDECNGHTHMIDGVMTYHYHFTNGYPWTIGCFKGCPDASLVRNIANLSGYGCPTGTTTDPSPTIEAAPNSTQPPSIAATASSTTSARDAALSTTPATRCGGGIRPVCSDGKRPSKCDDGSSSLPCPTGSRPVCSDGKQPSCPDATTPVGGSPTTRSEQTVTPDPARTLAPEDYPTKPNIVYILVDDLGYGDVGYTSNKTTSITPSIDQFANSSMILSRFYVSKVCTPTRGALLTGRYAHKLGLDDITLGAATLYSLPSAMETLPEALKRYGYTTAIVGKWHLGLSSAKAIPTGQGFDYHYGYYEGGIDYFNKTGGNKNKFYDLQLNGAPITNVTELEMYGPDLWHLKAVEWMSTATTSPKFLYYSMQSVHSPIHPPPTTNPACANDDYCNMVSYADTKIGQFLDLLRASPEWSNTLVVLSSDNGGAVPLGASNAPLAGSKGTLLEGGVHVPGILGGGVLPASRRSSTMEGLVHITDMYATLINLASMGQHRAPADVDGFNLWPTIDGTVAHPRDTVLVGMTSDSSAIIVDHYKLLINVAVRSQTYDLLVDLNADRSERVDTSANHTALKQRMTAAITAYRREIVAGPSNDNAGAAAQATKTGYWGPWLSVESTPSSPTAGTNISSSQPASSSSLSTFPPPSMPSSLSTTDTSAGTTRENATMGTRSVSSTSTASTINVAHSIKSSTTDSMMSDKLSTTQSTIVSTTTATTAATTIAVGQRKLTGRFVIAGIALSDVTPDIIRRALARLANVLESSVRITSLSARQDARRANDGVDIVYEITSISTDTVNQVAANLNSGLSDGSFIRELKELNPNIAASASVQIVEQASVAKQQPSSGGSKTGNGALIGGVIGGLLLCLVAAMAYVRTQRRQASVKADNDDILVLSREDIYDQPNPPPSDAELHV
eukprot:TRINITY_DN10330_c0_g2_i2.p1 TRINITY_DN10330_c0_g2~~TRINITY_DN10330_c0_g2_i2.p1  ORF type:complete len:1119 (+),score=186.74 TRINITY_DN10330_c0_g2_i2:235-3357(+)